MSNSDPTRSLRLWIYALLITVATGMMLGRIFSADDVKYQKLEEVRSRQAVASGDFQGASARYAMPFFSANDKSRWCTIRVLCDDDPTIAVKGAPYAIDNLHTRLGWDTIDKVQHIGPDGKEHYYSSKPPLLPTLMAASCKVVCAVMGYNFEDDIHSIVRWMLVLWNVIPLVILFVLIAWFVERFAISEFTKIFVVAMAVFATFLTTFSLSINNHLPAAVCAGLTLFCLARILFDNRGSFWYFAGAGFFAAFTAACDLPALALFGLAGGWLLWKRPIKTLLFGVPGALLVLIPFFATNQIAHESLRPAYLHRSAAEPGSQEWWDAPDNWYAYENSHWAEPQGIDVGEPSIVLYDFHILFGHHGVFSLTPIWILSLAGIVFWLRGEKKLGRGEPLFPDEQQSFQLSRQLGVFLLVLTVVLVGYYLTRPQIFRNYGGVCSGLRWTFWMIPLWLVAMVPCVDRLSKRTMGRVFCLVAAGWSVISVAYPTWNPWVNPWLYQFSQHLTQ